MAATRISRAAERARMIASTRALIGVLLAIFWTHAALPTEKKPDIPLQDSILRAVLWMRLSGEYEALCRQVYHSALQAVRERLRTRSGTKPPAVILDLDETVLDNAGYQAYLTVGGLSHSQERWQRWQRENVDKVGLVPGAKNFIEGIEKAGVRAVFITNRSAALREQTVEVLLRLGVATRSELSDPRAGKLFMREDTRDKENRRRAVTAQYDVLALIGDNLNDFSDDFYARSTGAPNEVKAKVEEHAQQWGTRWFVLPNPIYGYWLRSIDWDRVDQYFGPTSR